MKLTFTTIFLLFFTSMIIAQNTETQGVEKACMNYLEGFYEGDTTKLQSCFRPHMYKIGFWKNEDSQTYESQGQMTYQAALNYAKRVLENNELPDEGTIKKVQVLDVSKHTAAAKVTAWWGTDYILLSKEGEAWKIEQVLWEGPLEVND